MVAALALTAGLATGAWAAFGRGGHPFDDPRACHGSEAALDPALSYVAVPRPENATDLHYISHLSARTDNGLLLAASFKSTAADLEEFLRSQKLLSGSSDHLGDGRFTLGDGPDPADLHLCGGASAIRAPGVEFGLFKTAPAAGREYIDVNAQLDGDRLRRTTEVLLTIRSQPR
ncbi:hypothetical protein [Streptomyces sp. NPDC048641]|uniref:hypothetical protein n=1 Tax=unclassified Streptomyces TaxID=2593676 RepID=UPI0034164F2E